MRLFSPLQHKQEGEIVALVLVDQMVVDEIVGFLSREIRLSATFLRLGWRVFVLHV
jgi:hypothetical protein